MLLKALSALFGLQMVLAPTMSPEPPIIQHKSACATIECNVRLEIVAQAKIFHLDPIKALKIAKCESQFDEKTTHLNKDGSIDRGIYQLNSYWHKEVSDRCAYDYACNINKAMEIAQKRGWQEWACNNLS